MRQADDPGSFGGSRHQGLASRPSELIAEADALVVTAGAGMGVDSGLPDFRGEEGFWRAYPALAHLGVSFEEMACPRWFQEDPHLAWAFYGHRLSLYRHTAPHGGFRRLLEVGKDKRHGYFVFTSNVDGQFQKAGFAPDRIVECHGSIHHLQCSEGCGEHIWEADEVDVQVDNDAFRARDPLPCCKYCGTVARPNILMFGDYQWLEQRTAAQEQRFISWLGELANASARLVVVEVGAGMGISTVRATSERLVRRLGGTLIRINPRDYLVPAGQIGIPSGAEEGIRQICG